MQNKQRILILGASGMLGNAVYRLFSEDAKFQCTGTHRSPDTSSAFPEHLRDNLIDGVDVDNIDTLTSLLVHVRPDIVINCIGVVKQLAAANDALIAIPLNSLFPHRLARLCSLGNARLVHISTDCVFSGDTGNYVESDTPDAKDLYGCSKLLGEVDYPHAITLRTSIIGHELAGSHSLINWFLSQERKTLGYQKAIFSGLPTVELATVIRDYVIPNPALRGLYHVSADPINKLDLLTLVAKVYGKNITIEPSDRVVIDRSLNSTKFRRATGYLPKPWQELVQAMHKFG